MMKTHMLITVCVALPIVASAQTTEQAQPVGRYSIAFSVEGIYFLDTATGALWRKVNHASGWERVDSPVNRVPEGDKQKHETPDTPIVLELPKDGATIPMIQREKRRIPGSSETLFVQLGDITAGQVFVEVLDVNGRYLVERTSLKDDEFLKFKVGDKDVYLQITDMVNNLVGEDICKVRISFNQPPPEPEEKDGRSVKTGETSSNKPDAGDSK